MAEKKLKDLGLHNRRIKTKYKGGMVVKRTAGGVIADVCIYVIIALIMFCCIIPLWHVMMTSISDPQQVLAGRGKVGGILWVPVGDVNFEAYKLLFADDSLIKGFLNTIVYIIASAAFGMFINITGGYVLSRKTKLRPVLMMFVLLTVMFTGGLIPTYQVVYSLGMVNTMWALIIPGCTNAFFVIMLSNAFSSVPEATLEAARIDGAGNFRIMLQVALPQTMTMITVVLLNSIIMTWNAWLPAQLYLNSRASDIWPLQAWIRDIVSRSSNFNQGGGTNVNYYEYLVQYAVIIISTLPILVTFPFFQKKMEKGVISGAVKG